MPEFGGRAAGSGSLTVKGGRSRTTFRGGAASQNNIAAATANERGGSFEADSSVCTRDDANTARSAKDVWRFHLRCLLFFSQFLN